MSRVRFCPTLLVALAVIQGVACGNDDTCDAACSAAPVTGTGGAGTGGAGGAGGASPIAITADQWGIVSLYSHEFGLNAYLQVTFSATPRVLHPDCQIYTNAFCDVRICPVTESPPPTEAPDAGPIQVVSTQIVGQALIEPDAAGLYSGGYVGFGQGVFYLLGGEPLTFVAAGGEVPPFDVPTHYPAPLGVLDPLGLDGLITADPALGLTLTLTGSGGEGDELFIFGRETDDLAGLETTAVCTFPTAPGVVSLGTDVLGLLPPGYELKVYRMHRERILAGTYDVTIRLLGELANALHTEAVSIVVGPPL